MSIGTKTYNVNNNVSSRSFSLAKIFGYMFIGLLITTVVAFGLGAALTYGVIKDSPEVANRLTPLMICASIVQLILTIMIPFVCFKNNRAILPIGLVYCVTMGVMLSSFVIYIDWRILALAFAGCTLTFGIMALIATFTKGNLYPLAIIGLSLLFGAGLLVLFNWVFILFFPVLYSPFYWVVEGIMFVAIMVITMYDIWNINKIAESGAMTKDLELFCAFNLYVDFINIFIRMVLFLLRIFGRR